MCTSEEMACLSKIKIDSSKCLKKCSGLQISSYEKESIYKNSELFENLDNFNLVLLEIIDEVYDYKIPQSLVSWSK